jgi:hypothetical protein
MDGEQLDARLLEALIKFRVYIEQIHGNMHQKVGRNGLEGINQPCGDLDLNNIY